MSTIYISISRRLSLTTLLSIQLSPAEFRAYSAYLDLIALSASRESSSGSGIDADGTIRFDRGVVREFGVDRLGVPRGIVDEVSGKQI